jgi:tetratricopeptide (TPR) repeat protein
LHAPARGHRGDKAACGVHTFSFVSKLLEHGLALHRAGRLAEAERVYADALRQNPTDWRALVSLGGAQLALRRAAAALASFETALALKPQDVDSHHGRGLALMQLQRTEAALASFERALALAPESAELANSRGNALRRLRRLPEALASFETALALQPQLAAAHNNKGLCLQELGRHHEARESYQRAVSLQPQFAEAYGNLATVQCELGEPAAALASSARALGLQPGLRGVRGNLGNALRDLGRPAEALTEYEAALRESPDAALAWCNRGNALLDLGRFDEADASYERAVALDPHHAQAWFNRSLSLLLRGDFVRGLPLYEWRKRLPQASAPPRAAPEWDGSAPLAGRTLLVYADQALGDTLQFCRYARLAAARGALVILRVQPQLTALLASLDPAIRVIAPDAELPRCDYQCALSSLPLACGTTLETLPAAVPYLSAEPPRAAAWGEWLGATGFRVGIAWQGSRNRIDIGRSVPLAMFAPLVAIPGVRLVSLQKGEATAAAGVPGGPALELPGEGFDAGPQAFLDSAALIERLDLVITCDTALAHLAGALGRPVWVALKSVPDWRWLLDRADSPWYPGMRLFRQPSAGDWQSVFATIGREVAVLARSRAAAAS